MKCTMLGTGNALATKCYNTCFVLEEGDFRLLVDGGGGNGLFTQFEKAGFAWQDMNHIFVTHKHLDHLLGIEWMVRMFLQNMCYGEYVGEAYIYSHAEVIDLLSQHARQLLPAKFCAYLNTRLHMIVVEDGETLNILGREVTFFDIGSTKATQFGFMMPLATGKLTCCGDEPAKEKTAAYVKDSTWLLHEAFCLHQDADIYHPYEKHHSTVRDVCEMAQRMGVKNLLLYHTVDAALESRRQRFLQEGQQHFEGAIFVPKDLEVLEF